MPERLKYIRTVSDSPTMKENMVAPCMLEHEFQDEAIIPVGKSSKWSESLMSSWLQGWDLVQDQGT